MRSSIKICTYCIHILGNHVGICAEAPFRGMFVLDDLIVDRGEASTFSNNIEWF